MERMGGTKITSVILSFQARQQVQATSRSPLQEVLGLLINGLATRSKKLPALADSLTFAATRPTRQLSTPADSGETCHSSPAILST